MEHGIILVDAAQVKAALRCQRVVLMAMAVAVRVVMSMAEMRTVIDDGLLGLRLERTVCRG